MLLKVRGARHMHPESRHSGQAVQANRIPCHGQSVDIGELSRLATRFNGQFLSNPAYKRRRSIMGDVPLTNSKFPASIAGT
jgi:hypothetical protein